MELLVDKSFGRDNTRLCIEESKHCVQVLRHRVGDKVDVTDGLGRHYVCTLLSADVKKGCDLEIDEVTDVDRPAYMNLVMAVAPTKNTDRYEWFVEKATEMGVGCICPIITEHSERKVMRVDRLERLVVSAAKQSQKFYVPEVKEPVSFGQFAEEVKQWQKDGVAGFVMHCDEAVSAEGKHHLFGMLDARVPKTVLLIGPEGDFSMKEVSALVAMGFKEATLGVERLRTETAALQACSMFNIKRYC